MNQSAQAFYAAREFLLSHREDYDTAYRDFRWPEITEFNWALDHFDAVAARAGRRARAVDRRAGRVGGALDFRRAVGAVQPGGQLAARAGRRARRPGDPDARQPGRALGDAAGVDEARRRRHPGHHAADGGRPARPAGPGQRQARRRRRGGRGQVRRRRRRLHEDRGARTRPRAGATTPTPPALPTTFTPDGVTQGSDTLLLYFTSGTTAKPKLVEHTHASYPVGHLSTMYWIGLEPGDVHLNISSPGWAKHAWSNVFAPWIAEACVLVMNGRGSTRRR